MVSPPFAHRAFSRGDVRFPSVGVWVASGEIREACDLKKGDQVLLGTKPLQIDPLRKAKGDPRLLEERDQASLMLSTGEYTVMSPTYSQTY